MGTSRRWARQLRQCPCCRPPPQEPHTLFRGSVHPGVSHRHHRSHSRAGKTGNAPTDPGQPGLAAGRPGGSCCLHAQQSISPKCPSHTHRHPHPTPPRSGVGVARKGRGGARDAFAGAVSRDAGQGRVQTQMFSWQGNLIAAMMGTAPHLYCPTVRAKRSSLCPWVLSTCSQTLQQCLLFVANVVLAGFQLWSANFPWASNSAASVQPDAELSHMNLPPKPGSLSWGPCLLPSPASSSLSEGQPGGPPTVLKQTPQ